MDTIKKFKMKPSIINTILVLVGIFCISLGYSSFYSEAKISELATTVRLRRDTRITGISVDSVMANALSMYEEYNEHTLSFDVVLPESTSSIRYKVKVTNFGNISTGILSISGLPSNLTMELEGYELNSKLCDNSGNCLTGMEKEFYLVIKYQEGAFNPTNTSFNLTLNIDFSPFYTVSFNPNNGTVSPTSKSVMYQYRYGTLPVPQRVGYEFANWNLNGNVVTSESIMETGGDHSLLATWTPVQYPITFTGSNVTVAPTDLKVAYASSNTFKVKPSSGYYLNSITCDGGYTLSSFTTGASATGEQMITISNNSNTNGSTCTIQAKPSGPQCSWSNISYVRTNETAVGTLTCSSNEALASNSVTTSSFTSSNVDVGKITKVTLKSSTTTSVVYDVELRGIAYGTFDVALNNNVIKNSSNQGNEKTKSNPITVVGFEVNSTSVSLNLNTTRNFQVQVLGGNYGTVTYTSANPAVATVSSSGLITSVAPGSTQITVREGKYGLTKTINVSVSNMLVINYELSYLKSSNTNVNITSGSTYTTTLTPTNILLYGRPSSIKVYIGGSLTTNYTYNNVNGSLSIPNVKGDLKIVATANVLSNENISFEKPKVLSGNGIGTIPSVAVTQSHQIRVFSFTPTVTRTYTFWSNDSNATAKTVDPYAYLFTESSTITVATLDAAAETYAVTGKYDTLQSQSLVYNDDGGSGYNFKMSYTCQAGKTYYLVIRTYTPDKIQTFSNIIIQ